MVNPLYQKMLSTAVSIHQWPALGIDHMELAFGRLSGLLLLLLPPG